jgi:hypothetical protein
MSVATSARNGAIKVPDRTLFTKLRSQSGSSSKMKPSTMATAIRIRNTST